MRLEGIPASPGLAFGPIYRLEPENLSVREAQIEACDVAAELERFRQAIELSRRELAGIRDGIAAELGDKEAAIYDAHLLILDDPELQGSVERGVRDEHHSAAWVFRSAMGRFAAHFEKVEDEYLRERHADILDVERRVLRHLLGTGARRIEDLTEPAIVVAHDLGPSDVAMLPRERVLGFVTEVGGRTSHGAIVARGRGIPAVVSVKEALMHARRGELASIDGLRGIVHLQPSEQTMRRYRERIERQSARTESLRALQREPAVTLDGHVVELGVNLEQPADADAAVAAGADGVGLFRTEFFYLNRIDLPGEEEQYRAYRDVLVRMQGRSVLFRTMDLGGDKVASYLGVTHETNPFLGFRGIRLALASPEMFRTQIRAIYRASVHGRARMMFPMVSNVEELTSALALRDEVVADLRRSHTPFDAGLETGVMIETPSAVWMADVFARHAQFFSIGTNDLIQYTLAMDRDNERLSHLYEPLDPAILRSIRHTVDAAHAAGRWCGVCGEMAGDPHVAVLLVGLGVDELSMSGYDLPRVKVAIRSVRFEVVRALADAALAASTASEVRRIVRDRIDPLLPSALAFERG